MAAFLPAPASTCLAWTSYPFVLLLGVAVFIVGVLGLLLVRERRHGRETLRKWQRSQAAERSGERQLRLVSHELRALALDLRGSADLLISDSHPMATGIARMSNAMFDTADNVHEWTIHSQPVMREEPIRLSAMLDEATSALIGAMGPGQRIWNADPRLNTMVLRADRRALRHVFTRALTACVRSSRQHDPISTTLQQTADTILVVIENDQGHATADDLATTVPVRMTLAQKLMGALGGQIDVVSTEGAGTIAYTRVTISFPIARLLSEHDAERHAPPSLVPAASMMQDSRHEQVTLT